MSANPYEPPQGMESRSQPSRSPSHWRAVAVFALFACANFVSGAWLTYLYFWPTEFASLQTFGLALGLLSLTCVPVALWIAWRIATHHSS